MNKADTLLNLSKLLKSAKILPQFQVSKSQFFISDNIVAVFYFCLEKNKKIFYYFPRYQCSTFLCINLQHSCRKNSLENQHEN